MIGPIAILAGGHESPWQNVRTVELALSLTRAVLARGQRLLVVANAATALPLALLAGQYRVRRNLESRERPAPRMVMIYDHRSGPALERRALMRSEQDGEATGHVEPSPGLLEQLARLGVIDLHWPGELQVVTGELLRRESVGAVFMLGDVASLAPAIQAATDHHREFRAPLFAVDAPLSDLPDSWRQVQVDAMVWQPELGSRPLDGEAAEVALSADLDAAMVIALEATLDAL